MVRAMSKAQESRLKEVSVYMSEDEKKLFDKIYAVLNLMLIDKNTPINKSSFYKDVFFACYKQYIKEKYGVDIDMLLAKHPS